MKAVPILCFIGLLMACSLFKTTTKSSKTTYSDSTVFRFYTDSSSYEEEVLIWPKGKFSYSPATGFFGEAEKLLLKEKGGREKVAAEMSTAHSSAEERVLRAEPKFNWILWLLIAVLGVYLSFKFYKIWQF